MIVEGRAAAAAIAGHRYCTDSKAQSMAVRLHLMTPKLNIGSEAAMLQFLLGFKASGFLCRAAQLLAQLLLPGKRWVGRPTAPVLNIQL